LQLIINKKINKGMAAETKFQTPDHLMKSMTTISKNVSYTYFEKTV
jgi:hypothetical protein